VLLGAGVAVFLMWMLDMKLMSHFILSGVVSFYLATLIALVAAMDNPFRGEVSVSSEPYQMVLDTVMAPEPPTVGPGGAGTSPTNAEGMPAAKKDGSLKSIIAQPDAGYVPPSAKKEEGAPEAKPKEEALKSILSKPDTGYVPPSAKKEGEAPAPAKPKGEDAPPAKKAEDAPAPKPKGENDSDTRLKAA
jgi:hypothetical protein